MADWKVTATTICCDAVDDDATVIVYQDWITRCTGCRKRISDPDKEAAKLLKAKPDDLAGTWDARVRWTAGD